MRPLDEDAVTHRLGRSTRLLLILLAFVMFGFAVFSLAVPIWGGASDEGGYWQIGLTPVFAGFGVLAWRMAFVRLSVSEDGLTIVNVLRTRRLRWREIKVFEVGWAYAGISAVLHDGGSVTINAIQKSNLSHSTGKITRADQVVSELNRLLGARGGVARGENQSGS